VKCSELRKDSSYSLTVPGTVYAPTSSPRILVRPSVGRISDLCIFLLLSTIRRYSATCNSGMQGSPSPTALSMAGVQKSTVAAPLGTLRTCQNCYKAKIKCDRGSDESATCVRY